MNDGSNKCLPKVALDFIDDVVNKVRYRKKVLQEVRDELTDHFYMALKDCTTDEEKQQVAEDVIAGFGDYKMLGSLIRRGKKRCRPLWRSVVARTFQVFGLILLCIVLYCFWFFLGDASPSVDYLEIINEQVRPLVLESDNGWPLHEKAIELYVKPGYEIEQLQDRLMSEADFNISDLSEDERDELAKWVEDNIPAWEMFEKASKKPYCFRQYDTGEPDGERKWLIHISVPYLRDISNVAKMGVIRSKFAGQRGDNNAALGDCVTLMKVSRQWQYCSILIESLVGMSIGSYAYKEAMRVVGEGELTGSELEFWLKEMSSVFDDGFPGIDLSGERLFTLDAIQHVFTDGGPGGGHIVPKRFFQLSEMKNEYLMLGAGLVHAGRDKTIEKINELYDKLDKSMLMSPYEIKEANVDFDAKLAELPVHRYLLIHWMLPALSRVRMMRFENKAVYEAMLTVFAIKRWQAQKGVLPGDLNVLVEDGLLDELPDDPYSAGSLVYRVIDGNFTLYSVGRNFEDNNGWGGTDSPGRFKYFRDDGDGVFWRAVE